MGGGTRRKGYESDDSICSGHSADEHKNTHHFPTQNPTTTNLNAVHEEEESDDKSSSTTSAQQRGLYRG
eukprot:scaffold41963_cov67-Attheya_sp.AAC.3